MGALCHQIMNDIATAADRSYLQGLEQGSGGNYLIERNRAKTMTQAEDDRGKLIGPQGFGGEFCAAQHSAQPRPDQQQEWMKPTTFLQNPTFQ